MSSLLSTLFTSLNDILFQPCTCKMAWDAEAGVRAVAVGPMMHNVLPVFVVTQIISFITWGGKK